MREFERLISVGMPADTALEISYSKHAEQTVEIHYTDIGYIGGDTQQIKPRQDIST